MPAGANWTETETLAAFRLYCSTPFGKLHQHNTDIIELAAKLGRTPSAIAMKACNFASLDPAHRARGVTGLQNRSTVEEAIWARFTTDSAAVALEAENAWESVGMPSDYLDEHETPSGPTEATAMRSVRLHQAFFRRTVLSGYGHRCALTGLAHPALLVASHIIPWAADESRRADPRNGLCLNALADKAFDRGLITLDDDLAVVLGPSLRDPEAGGMLAEHLAGWAGRRLRMPERFEPDGEAVRWHRSRAEA
ncbi:MAG: HNH endonuclease [Phycisphaerales bacterium]|jgi:putative restriction endonuclease